MAEPSRTGQPAERRYLSERSMALLAQKQPADVVKHETHGGMIRTTDPHGVEKLHHTAGRHRAQHLSLGTQLTGVGQE